MASSRPRVVMTLLVRDGDDIVEANLRHHLNHGVDFVVATDNASIDGTRDMLVEFETDGVLHLIDEPGDDFAQHRWVTRMARLAAVDFGADWVIHVDTDEFWFGLDGDLSDALGRVPTREQVVEANRYNFVPRPMDDATFWEAMTVRFAASTHNDGGPLPPKIAHRAQADLVVRQGGHEVELDRSGRHREPESGQRRIDLLHFPMRTYEQFERGVVNTGRSYRRNTDLPEAVGHRTRRYYEQYEAGELPGVWALWALDDHLVESGLTDGSLVVDERLRDHLRAIMVPDQVPSV